jgi:hypothetical protein
MNKEVKKKDETKKDELFEEGKSIRAKEETPLSEIKVQEDLLLPRYQLLQNTSDAVQSGESKAGKIKHSITGEEHEKIRVIPIAKAISRIMFDPDNRRGTPLCMSSDGITGSKGKCQTCPEKDFSRGVDGKNAAPACSKVYNFLTIRESEVGKNAMPTILSFMKSSSNAGKKILTSAVGWITPLPVYNYVWEISTLQKGFPRGPAYILVANQVRETQEKEREFFEKVSARFSRVEIKPEISAEETVDEVVE